MDVDFDGHVAALEDLKAGTFFVTRSNEHTMLGISTVYGHDKAAVLFNQAFKPDEPFPCIVTSHYFGGTALIALRPLSCRQHSATLIFSSRRRSRMARVR